MTRRHALVVLVLGAFLAAQLPSPGSVVAGGPPDPTAGAVEWDDLPVPRVTPGGRPLRPEPSAAGTSEQTGRVLVRMRPGVGIAAQGTTLTRAHARMDPSAPELRTWDVVVPTIGTVDEAVAALRADPAVAWAEPEYHIELAAGPANEPQYGQQWALSNTGQEVNTFFGAPNVDMNVPEAWAMGLGSSSVTVAVIDSGIDFAHPDLAAAAWVNQAESTGDPAVDDDGNGYVDDVQGWDFCGAGDNGVFDFPSGTHGTEMASIIAASANGVGMTGVAPGVKVMALKFFDALGGCGTAAAVAAIEYAVDQGVKIANASWVTYDYSQALSDAIAAAGAAGMLVVAAAGNDGNDNDVLPVYPASLDLDNVVSVGAVHNEGLLSYFSNYGATSVDISAPGEDVLSAYTAAGDVHEYALFSGTSHATANVSGVAALIGSVHPTLLDASDLKDRIIATGKPLSETRGWTTSGRIPDARAAVVTEPDIKRLSGINRYATAAAISAATYFRYPSAVMVATGANFPDALSGGAVAAQFGFPLLLVQQNGIPAATAAELSRLQPLNIIVLGGTGVISSQVQAQLAAYLLPGGFGEVIRIAGANRYATSAEVSAGFDPGVPTAYIATGLNFPDALAAAPPAALEGGPLLLVTTNGIPAVIAAELARLDPQKIVILGGTGAVSNAVASQLGAYTSGPVIRLAGANRYATAAAASAHFFDTAETAFIATGVNFPDALAGGSSGGAFIGPLLLVPGTSLPSVVSGELLRLQPARVYVLGGTGVVSNGVVSQVSGLFP